jgi:hypothetical protein
VTKQRQPREQLAAATNPTQTAHHQTASNNSAASSVNTDIGEFYFLF